MRTLAFAALGLGACHPQHWASLAEDAQRSASAVDSSLSNPSSSSTAKPLAVSRTALRHGLRMNTTGYSKMALDGDGERGHISLARASECHRSGHLQGPISQANSDKHCFDCVQVSNGACQWCPERQVCASDAEMDWDCRQSAITVRSHCSASAPEWIHKLTSRYGEDLESRNMDVKRCMQWSLHWEVSPDENMKDQPGSAVGFWGCVSAMVRDAAVGGLGGRIMRNKLKTYHTSGTAEPWRAAMERRAEGLNSTSTEEAGLQDRSASTEPVEELASISSSASWDVEQWEPDICMVIRKGIGDDRPCGVRAYAPKEFFKLRDRASMPNGKATTDMTQYVLSSIMSGPVVSFDPGAGKSGSGFARTWDDGLKIKIGLRQEIRMGEVVNLLSMVVGLQEEGDDGTPIPLSEHLKRHPTSLLNRYFGVLRYQIGDQYQYVLMMQDATYDEAAAVKTAIKSGANVVSTKYDLKGPSRSREEHAKPGAGTLLNADFIEKELNQIMVRNWQCSRFREAVEADTKFLDAYELIDYSLFLTVAQEGNGGGRNFCKNTPGDPFCMSEGDKTYTVSIIDYVNDLNWYKSVESAARWGKFSHYGLHFKDFADEICPHNPDEQMRTWQKVLIGLGITLLIVLWLGGTYMLYIKLFAAPAPASAPQASPRPRNGPPSGGPTSRQTEMAIWSQAGPGDNYQSGVFYSNAGGWGAPPQRQGSYRPQSSFRQPMGSMLQPGSMQPMSSSTPGPGRF
eukprot:TRINITY_DN101345_c0_g1_i1.p1 TRINITY_DN101345_c0_g1~~TRINITY_DN101345_c0_g1_i1.p1  ORF type:complete len:740 (+),score=92.78 TRINITY_DN101345_c0_g1_i1:79-2298(+)